MPPKKVTTQTVPVTPKPNYVAAFENITVGMAKTAADKMNEIIRKLCDDNAVENPEEWTITMEKVLEWFGMTPPTEEKVKRKAPTKPREIPSDELRCLADKKAVNGEKPERCTGRKIKGKDFCFSHDPDKPKKVKKEQKEVAVEVQEQDEEEEQEEIVEKPVEKKSTKINLEIADEDESTASGSGSSSAPAGRRRRIR